MSLYTSRSELCIGCSAAETLREEFKSEFTSESVRSLCADVAARAARQVRAFRIHTLRVDSDLRRTSEGEPPRTRAAGFTLKPAPGQGKEEEDLVYPKIVVPPRVKPQSAAKAEGHDSDYTYESLEEDETAREDGEKSEGYSDLSFHAKGSKRTSRIETVGATAKSAAAPAERAPEDRSLRTGRGKGRSKEEDPHREDRHRRRRGEEDEREEKDHFRRGREKDIEQGQKGLRRSRSRSRRIPLAAPVGARGSQDLLPERYLRIAEETEPQKPKSKKKKEWPRQSRR